MVARVSGSYVHPEPRVKRNWVNACGSVIKLGGRVAEKSGGNGNIRKG
jgi:hypothetical protein